MRVPVIVSIALCLAACGGPPPNMEMPPPEAGVAAPLARELPVTRVFTGRIEPVDIVEISPRVSGTVARTLVRSGALVVAGQPLFELDQAPFLLAVTRAEAAVAGAEVALRQATETRDRNLGLQRDGLVAQQVLDDSQRAAEGAAAALAAARANLESARLEREWSTVRAPFAGKLGLVGIAVGSEVQGGGGMPPSVVTTLMSVAPVYAAFDLDEQTYLRLAPRLIASVRGETPVPVRVGLAEGTDLPFAGRIVFIDNHVDPASGTIRLRALLDAAAPLPPPGSFARIELQIEPPRMAVLVHEQAIQAQLSTRYVLVVDEKGGTSVRPVQPGARHGQLREVVGVSPEERIVVTNLAKVLMPGMPVAPKPVEMETLAPAAVATPAPADGK